MDKQEVISQLVVIQNALQADGIGKDVTRAFDMAIKALEKDDAIKVGDECRYKAARYSNTFVVTYIDAEDGIFSAILSRDGDVVADGTLSMIEKTGRHFDSVERLLEEVRG